MKILLDENLPHVLRHALVGHDVFTVAYMGWGGTENGALLRLAEKSGFDALLTRDAGLQYQQDLSSLPVAVIILNSRTNQIEDITPLIPALMQALATFRPKTVIRVA